MSQDTRKMVIEALAVVTKWTVDNSENWMQDVSCLAGLAEKVEKMLPLTPADGLRLAEVIVAAKGIQG